MICNGVEVFNTIIKQKSSIHWLAIRPLAWSCKEARDIDATPVNKNVNAARQA
jgi:hypothetical protein